MNSPKRMCTKETMIDTRPGTSTVGVQCNIWDQSPQEPSPLNNTVREISAFIMGKLKPLYEHSSVNDSARQLCIDSLSEGSASQPSRSDGSGHSRESPVLQPSTDSVKTSPCRAQLSHSLETVFNPRVAQDCRQNSTSSRKMATKRIRKSKQAPDKPKARNHERKCVLMDDESYELMVDMLTGRFNVPVKERTPKQRATYVRLWRNKGKFTVDNCTPGNLYFDGKRVLRRQEIGALVASYRDATGQNQGARRIKCSLREMFDGISERDVVKVMKQTEKGDDLQY